MTVVAHPDTAASPALPAADPGRTWLTPESIAREHAIRAALDYEAIDAVGRRVAELIDRNRTIHDRECINLNPASNVMNPRAEAALAAGLSTRASLGHPGAKYEMGLEAIEEIEVITADLARRLFEVHHAEVRVGSGALANLYAFMATCRPGDSIVVPPASVGGHVTHRNEGAAGLYGLQIHECAADAANYTVDLDALRELADRVRPKLITIGTSLNLVPHPVAEIRRIADRVGAYVLFDAAHACGMIAGKTWPNPLSQGAHLMTMSTYKSLGGPAGGLVLTNRADLAARIDEIAYPGLTANFDVGKTAALAITLLDWLEHGQAYAHAMVDNAGALAAQLERRDLPLFRTNHGPTTSHQLAIEADRWAGGHQAALRLRNANLLTTAIGLPTPGGAGGLRLGTPEITRLGMTVDDMDELAGLIADGLQHDPADVAPRTAAMRQRFPGLHHIRNA